MLSRKAHVPFLDPLEDKGIKTAWDEYKKDHSLSEKERRIRLFLIAQALRDKSLTPEEVIEALEESCASDEMHIVRICKGETDFYGR